MNLENYYMNLPKDLAGSVTKNRFRLELLWGINTMIDAHKELENYAIIFDFKCDIELHKKNEIQFFQIKTRKLGNYNENNLCKIGKKSQNSILGKLYALYSPGKNIKLAIVSNCQLKIKNKEIDFPHQCFAKVDKKAVDDIKQKIRNELNLDSVDLENVFYIFDNMDLLNPEDSIRGKLIKSFVDIKGEEPQNPNALYRLVSDTVKEKASYEFDVATYDDVVKLKGVTRFDFDKMLDAHKKESQNGIFETKSYINSLPLTTRRKYNKALGNLIEISFSNNLNKLKKNIYSFISENEEFLLNETSYLELVSQKFDKDIDLEFTDEMKKVQYLIIYYIYASGGEL